MDEEVMEPHDQMWVLKLSMMPGGCGVGDV